MCDLVLVDSPFDELRREICRLLHESLVSFCQKQLESSFLEEPRELVSAPLKSTKRRRNKRGKGQRRRDPTETIVEVKEDEISDYEESQPTSRNDSIAFPCNGSSERDRNRNTVLCLSILQEVLNTVFDTVGLEPDADEFSDASLLDKDEGDVESGKFGSEVSDDEVYAMKSFEQKNACSSLTGSLQESVTVTSDSDGNASKMHGSSPLTADVFVLPENDREHLGQVAAQPSHELISDTSLSRAPLLESFAAHYGTIGGTFYLRPEPGFVWDMNDDDWGRIQGLLQWCCFCWS
jgi:hypothetical protein